MNETQGIAIVAALIILAMIGCLVVSAIALFVLPPAGTPPGPAPALPPQGQPPPALPGSENQTPPMTQEDLETWNMINVQNVETACLQTAREQAGSSAGLVYGCDCDETVRADQKTYDCDISTGDPFTQYFANIDCFLVRRECDVETNYGSHVVTFEYLRQYSQG